MKVQRGQATPVPSTAPGAPAAAAPKTAEVNKGWGAKAGQAGAAPVLKPVSTNAVPKPGVRSAVFEAQLDRDTQSRSLAGNKVSMLFDGVNSFAERNKMIDGAKESICFQTFIFNSDETGWALAKKLAAKAQEGVQVRVIYDAMGSGRADPKMFELMKNAGVDVKAYGEKYKVWDLNDRWHEKHLIVDGKASVQGGMNIADEYALGGSGKQIFSRGDGVGSEAWRDADMKLEGPAVADTMKAFTRNWDELGGKLSDADRQKLFPKLSEVSGGPSVRVVQSNPEVKGLVGTTDKLYLRSIENAQKSITIENAYFLPPPEIRKALIDAAKRGVEVKVMSNSKASNDMGFVSDAARYFYDDMLKAGVQIFEKHGGTLHSKTATFDGEFSVVGSVNMNGRSKNTDAEVALAVQDDATARQLENRFAAGLKETVKVTLAELKKESFMTNLKQWALSTMAWTF
ncbi:MAG: phosphatidylserine/phosphatidylglycerophosphate/cardiolipin synthase family protein [Archangium sp.]|nr:phosphatidylserine/phosphatidylglycerophosphate/cardiolipin synthase family protein [Archangium sp.]MDP3154844.1 phosphatidylserine/phosphatidylglycerophosphate/cardiolipin synthase family protein [Archangium sp.]MDP3575020.1 phosphatidylserine/phosphatidylglycerophosphate/cardiolipin synthase family protein [Archangium sp.]